MIIQPSYKHSSLTGETRVQESEQWNVQHWFYQHQEVPQSKELALEGYFLTAWQPDIPARAASTYPLHNGLHLNPAKEAEVWLAVVKQSVIQKHAVLNIQQVHT